MMSMLDTAARTAPITMTIAGDSSGCSTLYIYPSAAPGSAAVVMCPGGGYSRLSMEHEGRDMAGWFNERGVTYAVLEYRLPDGSPEATIADAQSAMRLMREHCEEWHVDPGRVGIMGASAGGHLASTIATQSTGASRADFQILLYPVISMEESITHKGSRTNLLGAHPDVAAVEALSNERHVSAATPAAFIAVSSDDPTVPVANSLRYYEALVANGVKSMLLCLPSGGHGWGFSDSFVYKSLWTEALSIWLSREVNVSKE